MNPGLRGGNTERRGVNGWIIAAGHFKKAAAFGALAMAAVAGMAGCGGSDSDSGASDSAANPPAAATTGSTATTTASDSTSNATPGTSTTTTTGGTPPTIVKTPSTTSTTTTGPGGTVTTTTTQTAAGGSGGDQAAAMAIFTKQCGQCHKIGNVGQGRKALDHIGAQHDQAWIEVQIRNPQQHHQRMPAFGPDKLPDADLHTLAKYLASVK